MKSLLLTGTFLLASLAGAASIEGEKTAWKCELLPAQQVNQVLCRNGNQQRSIYTYRPSFASDWFVLGDFLFEKHSDIESPYSDSTEVKRKLAARKDGSLVYSLAKGDWIDSELKVRNLPFPDVTDALSQSLTSLSFLPDSRIFVQALAEILIGETGGEEWSGVLSRDGLKMTWFDFGFNHKYPLYLSEDGRWFYDGIDNDKTLNLWSGKNEKYLGYFSLTAAQANYLGNDKYIKVKPGKYNNVIVCQLKNCLSLNLKNLKNTVVNWY